MHIEPGILYALRVSFVVVELCRATEGTNTADMVDRASTEGFDATVECASIEELGSVAGSGSDDVFG